MAAVYSARLYQNADLNGDGASAVVPAGLLWVVRDISYMLLSGAGPSGTFTTLSSGATIFYQALTSAAPYAQWHGRQVVEAGEELQFATNDPTQILVSGYVLTLP